MLAHRFVDGAVPEVDVSDVKLDVGVGDDGVHGEGHGSRLVGDADSHGRFEHARLLVEELRCVLEQRLPEAT